MNTRQIKTLAIVFAVMLVVLFASRMTNDGGDSSVGELLFPDLKARINDITKLTIIKGDDVATVRNESGSWVLSERGNYPVDTGKLRQLLLALADTKKIEEKTSNPEMYARLGVEDPGEGSQGTELRITGPDFERSLIIGKLAQREYRYARIGGESTSWLIDQNPELSAGVTGWLIQEIIDIDQSRIQSVTISHGDGETIRIEKENVTDREFRVPDKPDGRELSYASVVNGIAGVLSGLKLQDVAQATEEPASATTVFRAFDGLEITIDSVKREDDTWITVSATQTEAVKKGDSDSESASDETDAESAADDTGAEAIADDTGPDPEEASRINERVNGWSYRVQSYKADQLRRRWSDILKAEE